MKGKETTLPKMNPNVVNVGSANSPEYVKIREEREEYDEYQIELSTDYFMQHLDVKREDCKSQDCPEEEAQNKDNNEQEENEGDEGEGEQEEYYDGDFINTDDENFPSAEEGEILDTEESGNENFLYDDVSLPSHMCDIDQEKSQIEGEGNLSESEENNIEENEEQSENDADDKLSKTSNTEKTTNEVLIESPAQKAPLSLSQSKFKNIFSPVPQLPENINNTEIPPIMNPNVSSSSNEKPETSKREEGELEDKKAKKIDSKESTTKIKQTMDLNFKRLIRMVEAKAKAYECLHENKLILPITDDNWVAFMICERGFFDVLSPCYIVGNGMDLPCQLLTLTHKFGPVWKNVDKASIRLPNESIFLAELRREFPSHRTTLYLIDVIFLEKISMFELDFDTRQMKMRNFFKQFNSDLLPPEQIRINEPVPVEKVPEKILKELKVVSDNEMVYDLPCGGIQVQPSGILFVNKNHSIFDPNRGRNSFVNSTPRSFLWIFTAAKDKRYYDFKGLFDKCNLYEKPSAQRPGRPPFFVRLRGFINTFWHNRSRRLFPHNNKPSLPGRGRPIFPGSALRRKRGYASSSHSRSCSPENENVVSTLRHPRNKNRFSRSHSRNHRSRDISRSQSRSRSRSHHDRSRSRSHHRRSRSRSSSFERLMYRRSSRNTWARYRARDNWTRSPSHSNAESPHYSRRSSKREKSSSRFKDPHWKEPGQITVHSSNSYHDARRLIEQRKLERSKFHDGHSEIENSNLYERRNENDQHRRAETSHSRQLNESYSSEGQLQNNSEGRWQTPQLTPSPLNDDLHYNDEQELFSELPIVPEKPIDFQDKWIDHKQKMKEMNSNGFVKTLPNLTQIANFDVNSLQSLSFAGIASSNSNHSERVKPRKNGQAKVERHCENETLRTIMTNYSERKADPLIPPKENGDYVGIDMSSSSDDDSQDLNLETSRLFQFPSTNKVYEDEDGSTVIDYNHHDFAQ